MNITVDANILVSELSGHEQVVRSFLLGPAFEHIYIAEYMWEEAQHELPKRFDRMVRGGRFLRATAVAFRITVVTTEIYNEFEADARLRVPDDPDDWHTIALALATDTSIRTGDRKHFWGCGIPVWNTRVLRAVLTDNDTPR